MLQAQKVGMAVGGTVAAVHVVWSVVVALGWGQALVDFATGIHFVKTTAMVMPFDFGTAVELVVITAIIGYVLGFVFATVWNKVSKM